MVGEGGIGATVCSRVLEDIMSVCIASPCFALGIGRSMNVAYYAKMEWWERAERV